MKKVIILVGMLAMSAMAHAQIGVQRDVCFYEDKAYTEGARLNEMVCQRQATGPSVNGVTPIKMVWVVHPKMVYEAPQPNPAFK